MLDIMALDKLPEYENRLRDRRQSASLSQKQLADMAGITRQAVCALEAGQYSPATSVALHLARALRCRVEDLFSIRSSGEIVEGELLGRLPTDPRSARAQLSQIGNRLLVRPLDGLGELASLNGAADGIIVSADRKKNRVKVKLLVDRDTVQRKVVVGGCDPAMFLASAHLSRTDDNQLAPRVMGSALALAALKRGEIHIAGIHLADDRTGAWKLPDLKRSLGGMDCMVVTFAHWEEGLIVAQGNPKRIRGITDLARATVKLINREKGSGARRLLDRQLESSGIPTRRVNGFDREASSHLEVASRVKAGLADVGIGVRAAASIFGIDFVPLQLERYDLIIPKTYYETLSGLRVLLDLLVTKSFREELEALGGYDTRESGKIVEMAH
jgi:putative molybdopterin biosynthesis protein